MKRVGLALTLVAALASSSFVAQAQAGNYALAALTQGPVLEGFSGPWGDAGNGFNIQYAILCVQNSPRRKVPAEARAFVPDGSSIAESRSLSTTAVVNACAEFSISVNRGAVVLPAIQLGQ